MAKNDYTPSKYQEAIFDYIKNESGNLVVEAAAGSGKTWTLVKSISFIQENKRVLVAAFNQDIVKELKKKTSEYKQVDCRTFHALGYLMLWRNLSRNGYKLEAEPYKYESYIRRNISMLSSCDLRSMPSHEYTEYLTNLKKLVDFGRFYVCQNEQDLIEVCDRYSIDTIGDEVGVALKVMDWGKKELSIIDYTDMIWLPNVLELESIGLSFDFIMVDECQDMNKAERLLILRCSNANTRIISFGDENQMIYGFAAADPQSFNELKKLPNTKSLPLSISYRCADSIVDFAHRVVPTIEKNNDKRNGSIVHNAKINEIKDGDMVLCRTNSPLVTIYTMLLKEGKQAYIMGKDISGNLKSYVRQTKKKELGLGCNTDGVFCRLYHMLFKTVDKLKEDKDISDETAYTSQQVQTMLDAIGALETLSEGLSSSEELIKRIDEIFSSKIKKDGIKLSTIHKAKGLEADTVFIACEDLMPSKSATKDWEKHQEKNLIYVAYTRAKNKLCFLDNSIDDMTECSSKTMSKLSSIRKKVDAVLNKPRTVKKSVTKKQLLEISKTVTKKPSIHRAKSNKRKPNKLLSILKN